MLRSAIVLAALASLPALASDCVPPAPPAAAVSSHGLRVGVALGSGSMHGMAHIGVIDALERSGLDVSVVSGTSVGALVGALWASGADARTIERELQPYEWKDAGRLALSSDGLMTNGSLASLVRAAIGPRPIESWPRRYGAVATNLVNGHRRVLMSGDASLAVQASTAVPLIFRPVSVDGETLGDGALVEPVPVRAARELGAQFVIAVDVAYRPYEDKAGGIVGQGFQAMHIVTNALAERQLQDADFALKLDVHERYMSCGAQGVTDAGRAAMLRVLPQLERALAARAAAGR